MLNLCWFKHKKIFECFKCFWKVLCFYKNWKISKTVLPNRELACWFWRLVCKWMVQSRGVHRDFRGSARYSLAGRPSSRKKHLENFFKSLDLKCFGGWPWRLIGDSPQSRKTRVLHFKVSFSKPFQFSLKLFMTFHFHSQLKLTQTLRVTLYKLHFSPFSPPNFQEKCMGSHFLTSYLVFWASF